MKKTHRIAVATFLIIGALGISAGKFKGNLEGERRALTPELPAPKSQKRNPMSREAADTRLQAMAPSLAALDQGRERLRQGDARGALALARRADDLLPEGYLGRGFAAILAGDAKMAMGDYAGALDAYYESGRTSWSAGVGLNAALCLVRLGRLDEARSGYSDKMVLGFTVLSKGDLPGTANARALEASLLLARGLDHYYSDREAEALPDFEAAIRLAPGSVGAAYYQARALEQLGRTEEAKAVFDRVAKTGSGNVAKDAAIRAR